MPRRNVNRPRLTWISTLGARRNRRRNRSFVFYRHAVGVDQLSTLRSVVLGRGQDFDRGRWRPCPIPTGRCPSDGRPNRPRLPCRIRNTCATPGNCCACRAGLRIELYGRIGAGPNQKSQSSPGSIGSSARSHGTARTAEAAFHTFDLADRAVEHQLARNAELLGRSLHGTGLKDAVVGVDRLEDPRPIRGCCGSAASRNIRPSLPARRPARESCANDRGVAMHTASISLRAMSSRKSL